MLSSISQPPVSVTSGGAGAAGSVLPGVASSVAAPARRAATTVKDALEIVDAAVGIAKKAGLLTGTSAKKTSTAKSKTSTAKSAGAGYAKSTSKPKTSTSKSTAKKSGSLAFLEDPKLSIEDKLMRLLAYLSKKWDKDIEKKLKDLKSAAGGVNGSSGSSAASSASKPKKSGLLGKLGDVGKVVNVAKQFFPQVGIALEVLRSPAARALLSKIGGPVLAAAASAAGFPALAPLALRYGPALVDLAAGVATSLEDPAGDSKSSAATAKGGASGTNTDGAGLSSDREAQLKLMEIQRAMEQQKEMFSLVSSILRSGHDTRMAVIHNVR